MASIAIVYGTTDGHTAKIADHMAAALRSRGHDVNVRSTGRARALDPRAYDGVIVGGSVHLGRHQKGLEEFIRAHRDTLNQRPSVFFSVCLRVNDGEAGHREAAAYIEQLLQTTGWRPQDARPFAGALLYRRYGFFKRMMMKYLAGRQGGDTDTSRNYEYTDWNAVARFAEEFADHVATRPPSKAPPRPLRERPGVSPPPA